MIENLAVGDVLKIDDIAGIWMVIRDEAGQVAANKALAGTVRVQQVFDGAGPSHLSANAMIDACSLVDEAAQAPAAAAEQPAEQAPAAAPQGVQIVAANATVVIPRNAEAYASNAMIIGEAWMLLRSCGLQGDTHRVEYVAGAWQRLAEPDVEAVPADLLDQVDHNHTYYDDGETAIVGPCRILATCGTSIHRLDMRAQMLAGAPRFAELDAAAGPAIHGHAAPLIRFATYEPAAPGTFWKNDDPRPATTRRLDL